MVLGPTRLGSPAMRRAWLLVAACLRAVGASRARKADVANEARAAEGAYATALKEHAGWCEAKRLFGKRDETYEVLLRLEPDHPAARKALRFARDAAGAWQ